MPTEAGHDVPQLGRADVTIPVLVEDLESLSDLLPTICVTHLPSHHGQELWKVDGAVSIGISFVDHVLEVSLRGVLSQGSHDSPKLHDGDCAISICHNAIRRRARRIGGPRHMVKCFLTFIEQGESLLEL